MATPGYGAGVHALTQAERRHAGKLESRRAAKPVGEPAPPRLNEEELIAIVEEAGDLTMVLREADPGRRRRLAEAQMQAADTGSERQEAR